MALGRVEYMRWAKALPQRRYALAASGVPPAGTDVFDPRAVEIKLDVPDAYGLPALIEAIACRYRVSAERVLPLPGTSMANFVAAGCVLHSGDRVLIEHPVYEPLVRVAEFLELKVIRLERRPQRRFRFDLDAVVAGLTAGARAVMICDSHNPSGLLCPEHDLRELARLTASHGAYLIVDEVYRDYAVINCHAPFTTAATLGDHVIVTNSLTKVYGLGPLRAGWMLAAPAVIERARDLFDHLDVVNSLPSQQLAVAALARLDRLAERTRRIYQTGYPVYREWLDSRADVIGYGNDGAVFEFPRLLSLEDTRPLGEWLAQECDTSIVPGAFFGAPQHIRISFTLPAELLAEGFARLSEALDDFRKES
ncbi:MAG: pyridoxal phosphate-dependent aminotransferase [Planctomycetota bacterium]